MRLLAIETCTEAFSVAAGDGERVCQRFEVAPRRHGELLLSAIDEVLLDRAWLPRDLDAVVVGHGPGAFTGVRMGIAAAQALALAWGLPLIPVSALASLAEGQRQAGHAGEICVALDARMGEVYWQAFKEESQRLVTLCEPRLDKPTDVIWPSAKEGEAKCTVCGHGWRTYPTIGDRQAPASPDVLILYPQAQWSLRFALRSRARGVAPELLEPLYLRNKVALTEAERR